MSFRIMCSPLHIYALTPSRSGAKNGAIHVMHDSMLHTVSWCLFAWHAERSACAWARGGAFETHLSRRSPPRRRDVQLRRWSLRHCSAPYTKHSLRGKGGGAQEAEGTGRDTCTVGHTTGRSCVPGLALLWRVVRGRARARRQDERRRRRGARRFSLYGISSNAFLYEAESNSSSASPRNFAFALAFWFFSGCKC